MSPDKELEELERLIVVIRNLKLAHDNREPINLSLASIGEIQKNLPRWLSSVNGRQFVKLHRALVDAELESPRSPERVAIAVEDLFALWREGNVKF